MHTDAAKHAFIAFGSNQGERIDCLKKALKALSDHPDLSLVDVSAIYETAPVGMTDQPSFLNMVAVFHSKLTAEALLNVTQSIEQDGGRERKERWGPRTIDLDILRHGTDTVDTAHLQIPHPRMMERAFVLVPLLDVAHHDPALCEDTLHEALKGCADRADVKRISDGLPDVDA
ncbi:2-amino-4-hydroxy-6-hydroxymethyldihydropteridine diphosphokinase [Salisediminibacterium selenitireducens]|uniref:2-amino-4-hydroxy-6-hydroxymethyldihydropteridine diphosphokinase n=1 Tax=Bacillus selenitireducens (strain ATCC 700615 / DSM 15326 / MLS10) TaxID=439292 RepID=D6XV67_BACIE|nr:2-amino-4-hydroxy-6-hydroxymethyldihydropteridine diphosphokinase [Salisediminibacterium selenitireducens]ADH97625.1 2-amino-4-hydroxy-6-hydroxymethyldihydropteridine pyrophosphokinase [[Bacillus] selenitireducens MLS10]